jgi:cupin superfamily acireductone dioxygenase involved in methionine salvage
MVEESNVMKAFNEINEVIQRYGLTGRDVLNVSNELHLNALILVLIEAYDNIKTLEKKDGPK